jgi:hypothetical protein
MFRREAFARSVNLAYFLDSLFAKGAAKAMNLFFLMPRPSGRGDELLNAAASFVSSGRMEAFYDLQGFAARIRRPKDPCSVALIWDPAREDLREIGSMRDLLTGVRVLLILHDQNTETIALAHKLLPAYIAYVDDGIPDIVSVLRRLAECRGEGDRA